MWPLGAFDKDSSPGDAFDVLFPEPLAPNRQRIITDSGLTEGPHRHGRDDKLFVWQLGPSEELGMDTLLPVEDLEVHRRQPWLLHMLAVNALNFCSFACCEDEAPDIAQNQSRASSEELRAILVAVPSAMDSDGVSRRFHRDVRSKRFDVQDCQ
jgi:hypothetical protein